MAGFRKVEISWEGMREMLLFPPSWHLRNCEVACGNVCLVMQSPDFKGGDFHNPPDIDMDDITYETVEHDGKLWFRRVGTLPKDRTPVGEGPISAEDPG